VVQNSRVSAKSESDEYLLYFFSRFRSVSRSEQFPLPQKIFSKFVFSIKLFTKKQRENECGERMLPHLFSLFFYFALALFLVLQILLMNTFQLQQNLSKKIRLINNALYKK
jgi:hypothetical protein